LKIPDDVHKRELVRVHGDSSLQKLHNLIPTISNDLYSSMNNVNTDKNKPPPRFVSTSSLIIMVMMMMMCMVMVMMSMTDTFW
jgi:hypothetical protein